MTALKIKKQPPGWWLILLGLLTNVAAIAASFAIGASVNAGASPGASPPWFYINQDLVEGLCSLVGMAINTLLALRFWNKYKAWSWITLWLSAVWFLGKIWQAAVIFFKTLHPFDPALRTTSWTDFNSFLYDPLMLWGPYAILVLIMAAVFLTRSRAAV